MRSKLRKSAAFGSISSRKTSVAFDLLRRDLTRYRDSARALEPRWRFLMATTTVDTLNSLLRGEIAATETYQQALAKIGNEPGGADLRRIHAEHRDTANALRKHVHIFEDKPDQGSGAWGAFAKAVEGVAKLFGNTAALKALKEGEEHGLH